MNNLLTFEQFLNEAVNTEDFEKAVKDKKVMGMNTLEPGTVRKKPSFKLKQGNYYENPFGGVELKKLVEAFFQIVNKKYRDAELLGPKPLPNRSFEWVVTFTGPFKDIQYIGFTKDEVVFTGMSAAGPDLGEKGSSSVGSKEFLEGVIRKLEKYVTYDSNNIAKISASYFSGIGTGDLDRLLIHLPSVM
jgi:hypothetical protein